MRIPFFKPSIGSEELAEVADTLKGGWLTTGPRTRQFEREFASYIGQPHAVAVNSCTAALHLALEAAGVKAADAVVVPTMTFAATAEVVRYLGARPLLTDCREEDMNLDVHDAEARIRLARTAGENVTAIMPVHYGGQICDMPAVQKLAERFGLKIVEDAAHCCPAFYLAPAPASGQGIWRPAGAAADISCFSFYANKCITTGEGGMACTANTEYAERMRMMSLHGISRDAWKRFTAEGSWYYEIIAPGFKYNMTDIAAALGIHQLRKADELHRLRTKWAELYSRLLSGIDELILPRQQPGRVHSWHLYEIRLKLDRLKLKRDEIIDALKREGIGTSVHWMPLHLHPYYRQTYGYRPESLPTATRLYPELISLPLYPHMNEEQVTYVCERLTDLLAKNLRLAVKPVARAEVAGLPVN